MKKILKKIFYRDFTVYTFKQLLSKKIGRFADFEKSEIKMNIKFELLSRKRVFEVPICKILLQKFFFRFLTIFGRQDFSRTDYFDEKFFWSKILQKGTWKTRFWLRNSNLIFIFISDFSKYLKRPIFMLKSCLKVYRVKSKKKIFSKIFSKTKITTLN